MGGMIKRMGISYPCVYSRYTQSSSEFWERREVGEWALRIVFGYGGPSGLGLVLGRKSQADGLG